MFGKRKKESHIISFASSSQFYLQIICNNCVFVRQLFKIYDFTF